MHGGSYNRHRRDCAVRGRVAGSLCVATAMLDSIQPARAASLETYGRLPSLRESVALAPERQAHLAFVQHQGKARACSRSLEPSPHTLLAAWMGLGEAKLRHHAMGGRRPPVDAPPRTTGMPWGLSGTDTEWDATFHVYEVSSLKLQCLSRSRTPTTDIRMVNTIVRAPMVRHVGEDTVLFVTGLWVDDSNRTRLVEGRCDRLTGQRMRAPGRRCDARLAGGRCRGDGRRGKLL